MVSLGLVAYGQQLAIRRNAVVVVALHGKSRVDHTRLSARGRNGVDASAAVIEQRLAVRQPVRRLDVRGGTVRYAPISTGDGLRLERAVEHRSRGFIGQRRSELYLGKVGGLGNIGVMRAHADAHVERFREHNALGRSTELRIATV